VEIETRLTIEKFASVELHFFLFSLELVTHNFGVWEGRKKGTIGIGVVAWRKSSVGEVPVEA
jgi:hypothetical protein